MKRLSSVCIAIGLICTFGFSTTYGTSFKTLDPAKYILDTTDAKFGGFYLDIDRMTEELELSHFQAHEIQNQFRDELEYRSKSFSALNQKPFLNEAFRNAMDGVVNRKQHESGFKPIEFKPGQYVIALDLDETVLSQWYKNGSGQGSDRLASLITISRDVVVNQVDEEGSSVVPTLYESPGSTFLRPALRDFIHLCEKCKDRFLGFVVFTAKEDKAAWDIIRMGRQKYPFIFSRIKGVFTRNYLKWGGDLKKPSKDLRIIDPSLEHVFLIDDNEGRVVQKDQNYRSPKFNADSYINSSFKEHRTLHEFFLPYLSIEIRSCVHNKKMATIPCLKNNLGKLSKDPDAELKRYLKWVKTTPWYRNLKDKDLVNYGTVKSYGVFEPDFFVDRSTTLGEAFPIFNRGELISEIKN